MKDYVRFAKCRSPETTLIFLLAQDAFKFHLIRQPFDFASWVDSSFLDQVLEEQQLAGVWPARQPL